MALKGIFVIAAACLLGRMEVVSSLHSLSSYWKREGRDQNCGAGNVMKINTMNCNNNTVGGAKECEVNITGTTICDPRTRFKIEESENKPGLYCIQFTDKDDSNKNYTLRLINGIRLVFEEGGCHGNIGSDFLFEEQAKGRHVTYRPSNYTGKCLTGECNKGLSVISVNNPRTDRKCFFLKFSMPKFYYQRHCR